MGTFFPLDIWVQGGRRTGKWVHQGPILRYIFVVFGWMTGRMTRWMTRRTDGWKASFHPQRRLLYKNIRSPFLFFFLFGSFFLCVFCIPFLFQFFFQKGFLNKNQKVKFHFHKMKKITNIFSDDFFFPFFFFHFSISQAILFYFRIALFFNNNHKTRNNL